ncbi:MAG: cyanophycin synthetase [Candidatus Peribacteraceae bacterium]|nr:cyanophycin synthetase [Candidatus Peribacteraceae bacterium]
MRIFCSGIGGIGLSAYAGHMQAQGHEVSGSDRSPSPLTDDLLSQGIVVSFRQDGSALPEGLDLLVYSEAIPESAPERSIAASRGIRQLSYFHALGEMTAGTRLICVSGTHGKSSTTAMAAKMLMDAGRDPNIVVGTKMRELNGRNWRSGANDLWIVEACEYRRSFLFLQPKIILLTNADGDHFDAYKDIKDYENAFVEYLSLLPADGILITHGSDKQLTEIAKRAGKSFIDADKIPLPHPGVPGEHMRKNAQLVLALADVLKIKRSVAEKSLSSFKGTWRRMEIKGVTADGVTVIDDYAHHPVEIKATLQAMREAYPSRRIIAVFQPHTHDRTLKLWDDFSTAFQDADLVVVTDVYDARPDRDSAKADPELFATAIGEGSGVKTLFSGSLEETNRLLRSSLLKADDVLILMGAGTVTNLAGKLLAMNSSV